jgi:hypothetical protein
MRAFKVVPNQQGGYWTILDDGEGFTVIATFAREYDAERCADALRRALHESVWAQEGAHIGEKKEAGQHADYSDYAGGYAYACGYYD